MKKTLIIIGVVVVVLIVLALVGPYYTIQEGEQAVVVQFGKIVRTETTAGLKAKIPFVESVVMYPKKIQSWDGEAQRLQTAENQFVWVDTTARWRISDPKKFYESVGTITQGHGRLDDVLDSEVKKIIARNSFKEAVRNSNIINQIKRTNQFTSVIGAVENTVNMTGITNTEDIVYDKITVGRRGLSEQMLAEARQIMPQYGIELIDLLIRQIKYSEDLTQSVYDRMIKERNQIAQSFRSDGEGEKAKIMGQMQKDLLQIQSDAERQAKEIKAKADATALDIRNKAYGQDPEFADYWMALEEYKTLLPSFNKTLTTDSDFFKSLYNKRGR